MKEPRIQYCTTSDGVRIAYWTLGTGKPLVVQAPLSWSNISVEWQIPTLRAWYQRLASRRMLVRYDPRSQGISERHVEDYSLDAWVADVEAVAGQLGPEPVDVVAIGGPGLYMIAYVAMHAEGVSRLVLWNATVSGRDVLFGTGERLDAMTALANADWEMATETFAHAAMAWSRGRPAHQWAAFMRASVSQADFLRLWPLFAEVDVSPLLPRIAAQTLVLRQHLRTASDPSQVLASKIPGAQLVHLEALPGVPPYEDEAAKGLVEEFLGIETPAAPSASPAATGLVTILFTDLASSTALTQRMGDAKAQELVRAHNAIVREALKANGGSEIKHTGDGIMASFPTASGALECAVAIQQAVADRAEANLQVHIGLNAGEPVAEESDLFGTSVQLARRICDQADSGQILVSNVVRELAAGKGFLFSDIGEVVPKGFEEPVRLYAVRWRENERY